MQILKIIALPTAIATSLTLIPTISQAPQANAIANQSKFETNTRSIKETQYTETNPLSKRDYLELEQLARQDGRGDIANLLANRANGIHGHGWLGIGRKAAVWTLRHGAQKLPAKIRPYAGKISDFLDATEAWEVGTLATGLISQGVPPDVATEAAKWLVFAFQ